MASQSEGAIRLFALGDARIETPKGVIEPKAEMVFASALYLILCRGQSVARRDLEELLWPAASPPTASHRLRQTLVKLKKVGVPVQAAGMTRLCLSANTASTDLETRVEARLRLPPTQWGDLTVLSGYEPTFSPGFSRWLDEKRTIITGSLTRLILLQLAQFRSKGLWAEVETAAVTLLRLAPLNEEATLALAESLTMRGSKLEGVQVLDAYLSEVGEERDDLKLPASILRKRIVDRMPAHARSPRNDSLFVGRSESMALLAGVLREARVGRGEGCLVWGEAGIGKSRLLAELASFAVLQGFTVVRAQCRASDATHPLSIFVDLVPILRGLRGAIGCSPETMKYLDRITHTSGSAATVGRQGDADFVYARVRQALFDLIDAVADETPILMIIEDVHRLDEVSANLFADILPWIRNRRLFLAFSGREQRYPWSVELNEPVLDLHVLPLDGDSSRELIGSAIRHAGIDIADDEVSWYVRVAEGNPYFLIELARHWIETRERHTTPPSLAAAIRQRISRLDGSSLQLLQTCALLDNNSSIERIESVLGFPHHQLLRSIDQLAGLGMLMLGTTEGDSGSQGRWIARHELLATAALGALSNPARAYLHRRIGTVLEAEITGNHSAGILWDCAQHWKLSGNLSHALLLARSCATHLMELGLCAAAADAFGKALAYCSSDAERLEILEGQVTAYFRSSDWRNVSRVAEEVRLLKRRVRPNEDLHDDFEIMDLRALWFSGKLQSARERGIGCLECQNASTTHRVQAGIVALMLGDLSCDHEMMARIYGSLRDLLTAPDVEAALRFEANMVFEAVCGDPAKAVAAAGDLIAARRESDSIAVLMRALTNGAVAARTAGSYDQAKTWLNEAISIAESHKLPMAREVPMQILASMALDENDLAAAQRWYDALLLLPRAAFDSITVRNSIGLRIALCEGNVVEARRLLSGDIEQLANDSNPHRKIYGVALRVSVDLAEGRRPDEHLTRELEKLHLIARRNARQAFATFILVAALRRLGRRARAAQLLQEYLTTYRREPNPAPMHVLRMVEALPGCD